MSLLLATSGAWSALRTFRLLRMIKLVKALPGLQELFTTLLLSLPTLMNVGALLSLFMFIWGCIGMSLFGEVTRGIYVTVHYNFDNIGCACLTMLCVLTGDSWAGMLNEIVEDGN